MSVGTLLKVVRDQLRETLRSTVPGVENNIRLGLTGQPTAIAGNIYLSIHLRDWTNPDPQMSGLLKDEVGLIITISIRSRKNPEDRDVDEVLIKASTGLTDIAETIFATLHQNNDLVALAGRTEPLRWVACIGPTEQYKSWYRSLDPNDADDQPAGYSMDVVFSGATKLRGVAC